VHFRRFNSNRILIQGKRIRILWYGDIEKLEDLAHSIGIKNRSLDFVYLIVFALSIALGIRFVGALLMGSLVIIPAAAAKNISRSLHGFMLSSVLFGVLSAAGGVILSQLFHVAPGPLFILTSTVLFAVSLIARKLKQ